MATIIFFRLQRKLIRMKLLKLHADFKKMHMKVMS